MIPRLNSACNSWTLGYIVDFLIGSGHKNHFLRRMQSVFIIQAYFDRIVIIRATYDVLSTKYGA